MDKGTITRTVLLVVALVNQFLVLKGITPIDEQATAEFLSYVFTVGAASWAWWKDNDITKTAIERKKELKKKTK